VAVKVVKLVNEHDLEEVEGEIRHTMRARHDNVVQVFGIVTPDDGTVWVVMELLGVSLEQANVTGTPQRMKYIFDIVAGMQQVHCNEHPVTHFDLNPANILLTQGGGSVKIIDFGVAQTPSAPRAATRGTMPYMAPELFDEDREPSTACDVYSFAVLVAELWTGTVAWTGTPSSEIPDRLRAGGRPFSSSDLSAKKVPDPIIALIVACWAQDPQDRPTFADLGKLRDIVNFHKPSRNKWPQFLLDTEASYSGA
jgi:serine/threonine protein kinase